MRRTSRHSLLLIGLSLSAAMLAFAADPAFTAIDYPGATGTQAWGINPRGDIVGLYTLADKSTRGFLLRDGAYSSIDFPGAAVTFANSLNPQGDVVGEYGLTLTAAHHGFLLSGRPLHHDWISPAPRPRAPPASTPAARSRDCIRHRTTPPMLSC